MNEIFANRVRQNDVKKNTSIRYIKFVNKNPIKMVKHSTLGYWVLLNPMTTNTPTNDPSTTYHQPTDPIITNLSTRFYLKDSAIERCSFYRTQAQLRIYKTILRSIIYLNLNRMSNISLSKLRSAKEKCLMTGFHKTLTLGGVNNTDFLSLKLLLLYSSL